MRSSILLLAGALCLAGGPAQVHQANAQTPAESGPVIRTETRLVLVDTVVTDKKGNYIRDLTANDFRVWEDGEEQTVKSFSFEAEPASPTNSPARYLVLFFDNSTMDTGDQARARQAAAKFIEANAGPKRLMAVVNFGGTVRIAQNFTPDAVRLKQAVSGVKLSAVSPNAPLEIASTGMPPLSRSESDFGVRSVLLALRSMAKNLASVPGRKTLVLFTSGFPLTSEHMSELTAAINDCNKANVAVYPIDVRGLVAGTTALPPQAFLRSTYRLASFTSAFAASGQSRGGGGGGQSPGGGSTGGGTGGGARGGTGGGTTSPAPGGKGGTGGGTGSSGGKGGYGWRHLGWKGRWHDPRRQNQPGTGGNTIPGQPYRTNPYGQSRMIIPEFPKSASTNQEVLYALATGTGGFVIVNTNDLLGGLEKIGREQNEYYMLGYSPAESAEGSCHTLRVKVGRGGTNVRARSGYCNVRPADLLAGNPIEKDLENRLTASQPGRAGASIELPFFYSSTNTARVNLAMEIPPEGMKAEKSKGKFHSAVNVLGVAYTPDGSVAARFSDTVKLDFESKKEWEAFTQQPFHYENQLEVASGQYNLKVIFSTGGENFGKVEAPLLIDRWDAKQFSLSGVALSNQVHPVSENTSGLDTALLQDRIPLVTQGMQIIPSGANRFKKTERPVVYAEIYEPLVAGPNPPMVLVQLQLVDRKTGETKLNSGLVNVAAKNSIETGNPVIPLGLRLPIEALTPGSYRVELTAADSAGNRSNPRKADFEVE